VMAELILYLHAVAVPATTSVPNCHNLTTLKRITDRHRLQEQRCFLH
jgi:hypothetical protein